MVNFEDDQPKQNRTAPPRVVRKWLAQDGQATVISSEREPDPVFDDSPYIRAKKSEA